MTEINDNLDFLQGGGEMGALTRAKDWSATSIGLPRLWPQSLRTTLSIILNSKFPKFLWWGQELLCFYNDAYRPSLGENGKHPVILGIPADQAWPEIWSIIKPLIDKVLATGEATFSEDQLIPIYRNGKLEDVYWTFGYSPVNDESGKPAGVFVTCSETTEKITTLRRIAESEERFRTMAESSEILIAVSDETGNVTYYNKAWTKLTGRPSTEFLKLGWVDLVHPDDIDMYVNKYREAFGRKGSFSGEFRIRNKDGDYSWLLANCPPRFREDGSFAGYISSSIDITDLRRSGEALQESENRLNIVIEASELGTWELNVKTSEVKYSPRYLQILGYEKDAKIKHKQIISHLHPDDLPIREAAFSEAFETAYLLYETRIIWNDKSIHWIEERGKVFYDASGMPEKIMGTIRDITSDKIHQQKLEESEKRFRNLVMFSPVPNAILKGVDHIVEIANSALLNTIWRKKESEVTGKKIFDLFPELLKQKYAALLEEVYTTGKVHSEYESLMTVNGNDGERSFYLDYEYAPVYEADNTISGIKITAIDVTEKVEARKKIEESENKLRILSNSLEKQVQERTLELEQKNSDLEKMNKELQSFAYISSHDLQEPLRKIQTFATRLIEKEFDNLSEKGKDHFKRMQVAAERMQTLIDDLLAYSRTNITGRNFERINLGKIIEEVKDDLQESIEEKHAVIEATELCDVTIIPFQFRQLIQNLISNSLKFTLPGQVPHIIIRSTIIDTLPIKEIKNPVAKLYCHITVSDSGIGFEQQYAKKIFDLFQRLHSKTEFPGTGIGLAIVKKIVDNHNGYITATGENNKGATFEIYVPVV